jgi:hypothetical protein
VHKRKKEDKLTKRKIWKNDKKNVFGKQLIIIKNEK